MNWKLLLLLVFIPATAYGQPNKDATKPDLSRFTSDQLKACYEDKKICGANDHWEISDELVSRLPKLPTAELVSCFANWRICGAGESEASGWPISDELARRRNPHGLLLRYWSEPNREIRHGIVDLAYHFKTPEATDFMRRVLARGDGDDEDLYWPASYLAQQCDPDGLKWLSSRKGRSQNCMQFADTIPLFGKCHHRPAIPYLVEYSTHDACLNVTDAAVHDLWSFYPHSPREFQSIEEMQKYFCGRAKQEGFKVDCESK